MHMFAGAQAVEAVELGDIVEEARTFAPVASILTVMEKRLADVRLAHELLPVRHQPQITSGRMLAGKILVFAKTELAYIKNHSIKGIRFGDADCVEPL